MSGWQVRLQAKGVLIADGAWGTELSRRGLPDGTVPEAWTLVRPEVVRAVAVAYVDAGADIILTNTFGGNRVKLSKAGLDQDVAELNRSAVAISREAAADRALVFASIGPTGEFTAPLGTISEAAMHACFAEQIAACAAGGAEAILVESMSDLGEARIALAAALGATSLPVAVSMTFDHGQQGYATMMGVRPPTAARDLAAAGAAIVGANCGAGSAEIVAVIRDMQAATDLPLWAKPNAGLPELVAGRTVFREEPEQTASFLPALMVAGARIIGGCCGTTPAHIRALAGRARETVSTSG